MKDLMTTLGIWKRSDMAEHLISYVRDNFPAVSTMNRSFYPMPHVIGGCMNRIKVSSRPSRFDQENVLALVRLRVAN